MSSSIFATHDKGLLTSKLYDEKSFYQSFISDLLIAREEVIIESPFITTERMKMLFPVFEKLIQYNVQVYVVTRDAKEHTKVYERQSEYEIQRFEQLGVHVLLCLGNHHRKLALIDRKILYEGSLNILSHTKSREIRRRIESKAIAMQMYDFLKYSSVI